MTSLQTSIGKACQEFREANNVMLKELTGGEQIQTLSSFECGRSSNMNHVQTYVRLAVRLNKEAEFLQALNEVLLWEAVDNG